VTYSALPTEGWFTFDGVIRHEVETGREEVVRLPEGVFCSEAVFAPRAGATTEDDGYVMTYTIDVNADKSECVIYDARRMSDGPVARIELPERISSGTHAWWDDHSTSHTS
jgi:carotenoid cleavage dioxygenase